MSWTSPHLVRARSDTGCAPGAESVNGLASWQQSAGPAHCQSPLQLQLFYQQLFCLFRISVLDHFSNSSLSSAHTLGPQQICILASVYSNVSYLNLLRDLHSYTSIRCSVSILCKGVCIYEQYTHTHTYSQFFTHGILVPYLFMHSFSLRVARFSWKHIHLYI